MWKLVTNFLPVIVFTTTVITRVSYRKGRGELTDVANCPEILISLTLGDNCYSPILSEQKLKLIKMIETQHSYFFILCARFVCWTCANQSLETSFNPPLLPPPTSRFEKYIQIFVIVFSSCFIICCIVAQQICTLFCHLHMPFLVGRKPCHTR